MVAVWFAALLLLLLSAGIAHSGGSNFVTGALPPPPSGSTRTFNSAAEPAIRSDPSGSFYIASENGLGAGTDAWKSVDGGSTYFSLVQPDALSSGTSGVAPGGGDVDLAVASLPNGQFPTEYNVYVSSLTLGSVTVSASQDGGNTWQINELGAIVPVDDREWIAAYGSDTYYVSYHSIATGLQIIVNEGTLVDGVPTTVATYSAINPLQLDIFLGTTANNQIGNIAVDQNTGVVYQVFAGCAPGLQILACTSLNTVYVAVGVPTLSLFGQQLLSFTDYVVYQANVGANLANNFPNVAVDSAGNVYAAWSDGQNVYLSYSTNQGTSWSAPRQVNSSPAVTAIYPWIAAGSAGEVDVVYYGTPAQANFQTCQSTGGPYDCQSEPWYVFFAQNLSTLAGGQWAEQQVTDVVHYGGVCQGGISCGSNGNVNRDLYDDLGVAVSPTSGLASVAYSNDQYGDVQGTANAGLCSFSQSNTAACDHTDFATQVSGSGVLSGFGMPLFPIQLGVMVVPRNQLSQQYSPPQVSPRYQW